MRRRLLWRRGDEHERLRGARILLVEDNPVNMMIAVAMLEQWGVDVAAGARRPDGVEAVDEAAADGRPFDAGADGRADAGDERPRGGAPSCARRYDAEALPIIALTAAALVSERDQALAAGMNDFLTKPIDAPKLRRTLARHVRRASGTQTVDSA